MKKLNLLCVICLLPFQSMAATGQSPANPPAGGEDSRALEAIARFGLNSAGANHRIQELVSPFTDTQGDTTLVTNHLAVLADGLNYWDGQKWTETQTEFELQAGYASATRGRHNVNIGGNLNVEGTVALRMPDNRNRPAAPSCVGLGWCGRVAG